MDPGARQRTGHPMEGQLFLLAGAEEKSSAAGREDRDRTAENLTARARVDSHVPERTPRQRKGPHQFLRGIVKPGRGEGLKRPGDLHSTRTQVGEYGYRGR